MPVDANFASLLETLKVEDPWVPPKTWESIPSESGGPRSRSNASISSSNPPLYDLSSVSEASLVRLAMNAMQGIQSAIISVGQLSAIFCSKPADRTFHKIPSLWNRALSTNALGNILKSVGHFGCIVFLLQKFVAHFKNLDMDCSLVERKQDSSEHGKRRNGQDDGQGEKKQPAYSLVNQAFSVAVGKVLEGYSCALETVYASALLRRSSKEYDLCEASPALGCLKNVVHSGITLLELYLHTKELRTQIEALGNICNLHDLASSFAASSFDGLIAKVNEAFLRFFRGGNLLTYLYAQLQVADPAHRALLKFLFLQSCEPYYAFIKSWIFKAEVIDPYKEFIVEKIDGSCCHPDGQIGISHNFQLASITERDGVSIPCFLKDFLIPLVRAGQQLQVLMSLLELCIHVSSGYHSSEDFLPCWSGFSTSSYSCPLTFSRDSIDTLVCARESYYKRMNEKIASLLRNLEVASHVSSPFLFNNGGRSSDTPFSWMLEENLVISPTTNESSSNAGDNNRDFDDSSTTDELSYVEDMYESSECSFSNGSEEEIESEQLTGSPCQIVVQEKYLSALTFSYGTPMYSSIKDSHQCQKSFCVDGDLQEILDKPDVGHIVEPQQHGKSMFNCMSDPLKLGHLNNSYLFNDQYTDGLSGNHWLSGVLMKNSLDNEEGGDGSGLTSEQFGKRMNGEIIGILKDVMPCYRKIENALIEGKSKTIMHVSSDLHMLSPWKVDYQCNLLGMNPLSVNPMLTRNTLLHLIGRNVEKCSTDHAHSLPYFNFNTVEDPCKVCIPSLSSHEFKSPLPFFENSVAPTNVSKIDNHNEVLIDISKVDNANCSLESKGHNLDSEAIESGGSNWERLLGSSRKIVNDGASQIQSLWSTFEMPLDIIIDKCLLQEIMLQYKYVSKLTIKLLEETFELQEHLLALRRYHFMEFADWADLFILSLWHHRWGVMEADQRLPEIQSFLQLSLQKSSCERDRNKDRLYVYVKGHGTMHLCASAVGVHSFDFLGLGYRVDWPVSIVLTPGALKVYADIFNFLIQLKLAIFSLSDAWCSLKDMVHVINNNGTSNQQQHEAGHLNILIKTRHQVNHFVSTLQQYVESQLSHVSWCRFIDSLQHKVRDMMDLESVHMEYLLESLDICFLNEKAKPVFSIIEGILQCALDFRSCLSTGVWDAGVQQEDSSGKYSTINMSQVLPLRLKFEKNLKELHLCYLKAPKHGKFGLSLFWEYLNYNEYYLDIGKGLAYYAF